jgi:hypothetical protein
MEWIIKLEGKKNQRILIKFEPQLEQIFFYGQYKPNMKDLVNIDRDKRTQWVDFSMESYSMNITLELINEMMVKVYKKMNERLEIYQDLSKSFIAIDTIELQTIEEQED